MNQPARGIENRQLDGHGMSLTRLFRTLIGGSEPEATAPMQRPATAPAPLRVAPQTVPTAPPFAPVSARGAKVDPFIASLVASVQAFACSPRVVLIGAGDGTFATELLTAIAAAYPERVTAPLVAIVDEFEAAGGLPMRTLHAQLKGVAVRPKIVPEPIDRAVVNIAHRHGRADIVLIADQNVAARWDAAETTAKLLHDQTTLHVFDGRRWNRRESLRRAA